MNYNSVTIWLLLICFFFYILKYVIKKKNNTKILEAYLAKASYVSLIQAKAYWALQRGESGS